MVLVIFCFYNVITKTYKPVGAGTIAYARPSMSPAPTVDTTMPKTTTVASADKHNGIIERYNTMSLIIKNLPALIFKHREITVLLQKCK